VEINLHKIWLGESAMKRVMAFVLLAGLLSGCVSSGRKIDQAAVETITKGETTKAQVINLLGSPDQITKLGNGDTIFMYNYMRATPKPTTFIPIVGAFAGGANLQHQNCMVIFGPDGVVKNYTSTQGGTEAGRGLEAGGRATIPEVEEGKRPK
jgi:outer membrane protein assembly factor BamE (lipoprotein component of BamABCDE complex)